MSGNNKMLILQESQTLEFKKIWKDEYLKTICAFANTDGKTWDDVAVEEFTLDEIDLLTIKKFKLLAKDRIPNIDKEDDLQELLKKLNLYDGKYLKRAAILLFAKDPQKYFIQSHSKIGRFLSETDIQSSDIIEGNLIDQVDKIMDVLRLKYLKAYISYEGMHRREKLEYPYDALKEAVINALIHRDYSNTSNLQIKVYDERLVMYNGATLSQEVPIERFGKPHQSKPFNPTIASVFYKAGFIENWGKGTLNIIDECVEYGLPIPTFEYEWTAVRTTFYKTKLTTQETTQETAQETAQENTKEKILELLRQNPKYTKSDLMQILDKADGTIKEHLSNLKKEGKLKRVGSTKSGSWEVNNDK
jgi:ATP-dependent DNA helicase RecG